MLPEDVLIPFPAPRARIGAVSQVRSTLLSTSLAAVRRRGRLDEYATHLPPEHREVLLHHVVGVWIPIHVAVHHYRACDALRFDPQTLQEIGMEVGDRIHGTFLGTVVRMAKAAGVTPWNGLMQSRKLWERMFVGGGVELTRLGPKEARVHLVGVQMANLPYFRAGFRSMAQVGVELFCRRAYVHDVPGLMAETSLGIRIAWV